MRRAFLTSLLALGLTVGTTQRVSAQADRHELGVRLKQFEQAWEKQTDPTVRKTALVTIPKVTNQFFSLQLGEAGRTLDEARYVLQGSARPTDAVRYLEAIYPTLDKRIVPSATASVTVTLRSFYTVKGEQPKNAVVEVLCGTDKPIRVALGKLPQTIECPVTPISTTRDQQITMTLQLDEQDVAGFQTTRTLNVMRWQDVEKRLKTVQQAASTIPASPNLEQATLASHAELLLQLAQNTPMETDYPVTQLIAESETFAKQPLTAYFTPANSGQYWITVPTGKNQLTTCRVLVPTGLKKDHPVPVVIAMHGAGGSENLFFEGYGAGHIVRECEKRGWLLIAPRSGLLGAPPVAAIVEKLAERYPLDPKRMFLVGHSMGAGQAVEVIQQNPGKFKAVALLGGAGRIRKPEAFAEIPVFIGVGTKDQLAFTGAKSLSKALATAGAKNVTDKEYADIEHMVIVREALPDVFAAWDQLIQLR